MTHPARPSEGSSPLAHMVLLAGAPERLLALRLAMSSAISPSSAVLDAARALAEENGVADRIEFRQCDLADLPGATGRFDVVLGMI